jgi:antitoxin component YwqK of YwqJK toxin-antitoxin module
MKNVMRSEIVFLFSNKPWDGYYWFSGYDGEGICASFSENGKIHSTFSMKNGKLIGELIEYFPNGSKRLDYWQPDGEYRRWEIDGRLVDHSWRIGKRKIVDFIKNPELKKEYNI